MSSLPPHDSDPLPLHPPEIKSQGDEDSAESTSTILKTEYDRLAGLQELSRQLPTYIQKATHGVKPDHTSESYHVDAIHPSLAKAKQARYEQETRRREVELELRKKLTTKIYRLISVWLGAIYIGLITIQIFGPNKLSDASIIALLTTTTINVIALLLTVMMYLFPKPNQKIKKRVRPRPKRKGSPRVRSTRAKSNDENEDEEQ